MQKNYVFMFLIVGLIIISNFATSVSMGFTIGKIYQFESPNSDFSFGVVPSKGRDLAMMEQRIKAYQEEHPVTKEVIICRTFKKNYLKFWMWGEYLFRAEWQYPYCGDER